MCHFYGLFYHPYYFIETSVNWHDSGEEWSFFFIDEQVNHQKAKDVCRALGAEVVHTYSIQPLSVLFGQYELTDFWTFYDGEYCYKWRGPKSHCNSANIMCEAKTSEFECLNNIEKMILILI